MTKPLFTQSNALCLLFLTSLSISAWTYKFNFNSDGEFTVLQFTDLHYGDLDELDPYTQKMQRDMIARVKPDLIVVSGDVATGYRGYYYGAFHKPHFFKKCWEKSIQPIAEAKIPYAYTIGNHDLESELDRYEIAKLDMTHPWSVRKTSEGIPDTLNFYIPIYSSQDQNKLALNIWLFDTGRTGCMGHEDSWGCIEEHQIQWYERETKKIKAQHGTDIHHIAFLHIPIPEFMMLSDEHEIYGNKGEAVCCPNVNTGFFNRVKASNDISAMFVGHDHYNNYGGWYDGIELVYGQKSGHGGYGDVRGVRVLKFKENIDTNGKVNVQRDHYIIFEDGKVEKSKSVHPHQGQKQRRCPTKEADTIIEKLAIIGFFDKLLLAGGILFVLVGFCVFRRIKSSFSTKQPAFNELTDASHQVHEEQEANEEQETDEEDEERGERGE